MCIPDEGEAEGKDALEHHRDQGPDEHEEIMVLDALCIVMPPKMVPVLVDKKMAKEAWDAIAMTRVGDDRVKNSSTVQL